ncbi:ADP-ribosyltransferase-containing protein [Pseudomonas aeruginosa]
MTRKRITEEQLYALQPTNYGRSKVRHPDGRPLLLFHGTARDNEAFRSSRFEGVLDGSYFTDVLADAVEFAEMDGDDGAQPYVLACFVRLENPVPLEGMRSTDLFPGDVEHWQTLGYDGAIGVADGKILEYVGFTPEQIEPVARGNVTEDGEIVWELIQEVALRHRREAAEPSP